MGSVNEITKLNNFILDNEIFIYVGDFNKELLLKQLKGLPSNYFYLCYFKERLSDKYDFVYFGDLSRIKLREEVSQLMNEI